MGKSIEVSRIGFSAAALREVAASIRDGAVVRRRLAIALILEGHSRAEAARLNGLDRQTLRDWVHRYNEEGIAGLRSRTSPGRPAALSEEQMEELRVMLLEGPDRERNGMIRCRCADLRDEIAARWSVRLHERSAGRVLHRLDLTRLQPRPYHPQKDAAAQEAFKKNRLRRLPSCGGRNGCDS
ncbi:MAG: IS630 family transposase [Acetobacteraceae bacterium]